MDLKGQVAVITGGSRGIGRGITLALAGEGADVVVNYRKDAKAAEEVLSRVKEMGRKGLAFQGDVSNFDPARELMKQAYQAFGRIDILVNNAGIASRGNPVEKTEIEEWNRVLSTNLTAVFYCSKAVLEYMHQREKGNIINISSVAASLLQCNPGILPMPWRKQG